MPKSKKPPVKVGRPRIISEIPHAYIVHDNGRFRLCINKRTPQGPRRKNLTTLGTHRECATVAGALSYWQSFLDRATKCCKAEFETYPDTYKNRRPWQRAASQCDRARTRLAAILPYLKPANARRIRARRSAFGYD